MRAGRFALGRVLAVVAALTITAIALTGCNTIHGMGEDIQGASEVTEDWLASQ